MRPGRAICESNGGTAPLCTHDDHFPAGKHQRRRSRIFDPQDECLELFWVVLEVVCLHCRGLEVQRALQVGRGNHIPATRDGAAVQSKQWSGRVRTSSGSLPLTPYGRGGGGAGPGKGPRDAVHRLSGGRAILRQRQRKRTQFEAQCHLNGP